MECFNPRPCARGDLDFIEFYAFFGVSIHAPARGATNEIINIIEDKQVLIHAPARGATVKHPDTDSDDVFQSTPLREGRLLNYNLLN